MTPSSNSTPHAVLVLALCPALAVSGTVANALGLGVVAIVAATTTLLAAVLLKGLPDEIRWLVHTLILAAVVSVCALLLNAWFPELYRSLDVFLPLLAANAVIVLRAEAAAGLSLPGAALSGLRTGVLMAVVLLTLGLAREIVGHGSVLHDASVMFGDVLGDVLGDWANAGRLQLFRADMGFLLAMLPPGAFIAFGLLLAGWNWLGRGRARRR